MNHSLRDHFSKYCGPDFFGRQGGVFGLKMLKYRQNSDNLVQRELLFRDRFGCVKELLNRQSHTLYRLLCHTLPLCQCRPLDHCPINESTKNKACSKFTVIRRRNAKVQKRFGCVRRKINSVFPVNTAIL